MSTTPLTANRAMARCILMGTGSIVISFLVWKMVTTFVPDPPFLASITVSLIILIMIGSTAFAVMRLQQLQKRAPQRKKSIPSVESEYHSFTLTPQYQFERN
ncbi:MAG: hypothetical protein V4507_03120 [Verrucomicrobiota bacterium]